MGFLHWLRYCRQMSLRFDRDYGIDRRKGWTVTLDGRVERQFVSLPGALWELARLVLTYRKGNWEGQD